ncbi:hypothetical protein EAX61_11600 [Dokdonia sinensis]|uniref:Uncharacterized protein n=1 Tax=Dokdonia sinensis TaxID=2479847 RepID=A0A3M0FXI5_9FLAO|nr:hypothetical protein [Dokdonia sinensis]RMB57384.1 hypothetical protein EAX61_11600 [Dokdonia sinensis]
MKQLKLIWDFRGPVAAQTAAHHVIHLKEYASAKALKNTLSGTETQNDMHTLAYLVVDEVDMPPVRDDLKPHRGQLYIQN